MHMKKNLLQKVFIFCSLLLLLSFIGQAQSVFINEIHYDNDGTDADEGVEIAGPASTDLTGWQLVPYNGNGGVTYSITDLSGTIPDQQSGFGTLWFAIAGLQNGAPDGIALVDGGGVVVQFLSYEGSFEATSGPALGMTSVDIGVAESGSTPVGYSMQLTGTGSVYTDYTWAEASTSSYGAVNTGQTFEATVPDTDPPVGTFDPEDAASGVFITIEITITFDEAVRNIDDSEINDVNVGSLIVFKKTDISGTDVAFTATIDLTKKIITLTPDAYLDNNQVYFLAIAPVEDAQDNATTGESITFTTIDAAGKEIHVEVPAGGETYYAGDQATVEWYSANVTTVNIDAWDPYDQVWVPQVTNTPSDGSEILTVPADAPYSEEYKIRVIDVSDAQVVDESPTFTVIATPTIYLIQSTITVGEASDYAGQRVQITGVVTAIDGGNFWLQDGAGAWNGIMGYDYDAVDLIDVGDNVTLDADVTEYLSSGSSETELQNISNLVVNSSGNPLPEATVITTGTYSEEYEAVLVKIVSATVVNEDAGYGEFIINDGSGDLIVGPKIYAYTSTLNETIGVTGIGHEEYGDDKILPRSADDIVDLTAPTFTSVPGDSETDVAIDASIVITFNEAIRNIDDSDITDANVGTLLTLKKTDGAGEDVSFTATIGAEKKVITIVPDANLDFLQVYYVGIEQVEDANDNALSAASFTFTTVTDLVVPGSTSVPNDAATGVAVDVSITITFDEAIRNIDNSEITDANVAALITFKETDDAGADVAFTATIDAGKLVITITPDADLSYTQVYYIAIAPVEDLFDNATTLSSFTFTTMDDPSSIKEVESGSFIDVYPNPNHGKFMLKLGIEEGKLVDVEIMNIQGKIVYRDRIEVSSTREESIDISNIPSGLYFIRVTSGDQVKYKKILIN